MEKTSRSALHLLILGLLTAAFPASAAGNLVPLEIEDVRVGGEIGRRIDITINNNVLAIDVDKDFLEPFRQRNRQGGYIGLGKFIDSLVRFAAYSHNEEVLSLKTRVVRETIATQEKDGYIGLRVPESRMWHLWDIHEMGYLVLGLTADHRYFGETPSLEAARKLADYIIRRWSVDPERKTDGWVSTYVATTGLEEAMLALHRQTADGRYLDFCVEHRKLPGWKTPLIPGPMGKPRRTRLLSFVPLSFAVTTARIQPDVALMNQSRRTLDFLLRQDGLLAPGLCGYHECWHSNQQGFYKLGETCATAYLIRWLDALLRTDGASLYGDIMERAIYNGLFAAQSPDGRRLRYYAPFEGQREYFSGDTYCCPCNFRRVIAELPGLIYYRQDDGLAINLYTQSSATMNLRDGVSLEVRQETDYPNSGDVAIHLRPSKPCHFPLYLRIPRWCDTARITINGDATEMIPHGGSFCAVVRRWRAGDEVRLHMPMPWRVIKGRKSQAGRVAVMRGPSLFCLNPERQEDFDAQTMKLLRIDPSSLKLGESDQAIRADGLVCQAAFWKPTDYNASGTAPMKLMLTEYADPGCQWTYFLVPNPEMDGLVEDELAGCEIPF